MREINIIPEMIILESVGRNTAPVIALGTIKAKLIEKDPIFLIPAADYFIQNVDQFIEILKKRVDYAEKGNIVNFEIKPTSPETGHGYIEAQNTLELDNGRASQIAIYISD